MQTFKVKKLVRVLGYSLFLTLAACSKDELAQEQENLIQVQAYLGLAEVYLKQGQFRASVIETQNAVDLMPRNPEVLSFISRLYLEIGDLTQASEQLDIALQINPEDPELKLLKAETLLSSSKFAEATALVNSTNVPAELTARKAWLIGNLQAATGNREAAETSFNEALAADNAHVPSLLALARLAMLSGNPEQAATFTDRAAALASENPDVWIWKGQMAMVQEDYVGAEEAFKEALDIMAAYDIMTAKKFGTLQAIQLPLRALQKNDEALIYSEMIAATPQGEFTSAFNNVLALFQQGSADEAETALNELLKTSPDHPGSNILLGISRYSEGKFTEAEQLLSQYVQAETASPQLLATLAATHLQMNQPEKALATLQQASAAAPDNVAILIMIGAIQRGMGDLSGALSSLNSALAVDPASTDALSGLAAVHTQQGNFPEAIGFLERAMAIAPDSNELKSAFLNVLTNQGDLDAAKQRIDSWLATDPSSPDNNFLAGVLALNSNDAAAARTYFDKVLAADPERVQAKLHLARADIAEQKFDAARTRFDEVLTAQPDNADAIGGILALGAISNSVDASVDRIEQLIAANPDQFVPPLVLSQYYLQVNDLGKGLETAEKAFSIRQNNFTQSLLIDSLLRNAVQAMQSGNSPAATAPLTRLLEIENNNIRAHALLAGIAASEGNYLKAMEEVTLIRNLEPDAAISHEVEGDVLQTQNKPAEALASYQAGWAKQRTESLGFKIFQALKGGNQSAEALTFLQEWAAANPETPAPLMLIGMEYQGANREREAIESYEQVYALDPNNVIMLNNLAWLYQDSSPERALELSSRAAGLYPQNAEVLDTYGWILYKQGKGALALTQLENAAKLAPDSMSIQEHLSMVRGDQ